MVRRTVPSVFLLAICLFCTSCAPSLFRLKPVTELPPLPDGTRSTEAGDVTVRVAPLLSDEESQDLFEANLQISGVLPVRVELESKTPIELKKVRFRLRDAQSREWKLLKSKDAVSVITKANGVFLYNPNSRRQFEKELGEYVLDIKTPLGERRSGFLFFQTPDRRPVTTSLQLTLTVDHLPQTATIVIN